MCHWGVVSWDLVRCPEEVTFTLKWSRLTIESMMSPVIVASIVATGKFSLKDRRWPVTLYLLKTKKGKWHESSSRCPIPSLVRWGKSGKYGSKFKPQSFHISNCAVCELRAVAITSRKHVTKHFRVAKKVLCSMATEGKSVSNSRSLCNICWIYPAW